jgi:uncharacterized protein
MNYQQYIVTTITYFIILIPFLAFAYWRTKQIKITAILLFLLVMLLDNFVLNILKFKAVNYDFLTSTHLDFLTSLHWNWAGKVFETLLGLIFIFAFRKISFAEYGFTYKVEKQSWKPIIIVYFIYSFLRSLQYFNTGFALYDLEEFLFQATMPGIAEELIYRGVLLGLLNYSFGKNWTLFGAKIGWGSIITSVLFGLIHGLSFTDDLGIIFNWQLVLLIGVTGFIFAWTKERSGSLIPGILGHNITNLIISFF